MLREPMSAALSSLPESFHAEREELLQLLLRDGILYRTPTQPVLSRDGTSARWMLDTLSVTLSPRGAELAGRCLLKLLERFDGRQIATYGLTAVPILQSCILQSGGRYSGLLVRKERKAHGSLKLIEGRIDPDEPTILIDDSISSGTCMMEGSERLEEAGLRVEGGVALVRFGWYGGYARMQERGYHVEAVYDIWDDFIARMEDEQKPLQNPSKYFPAFEWSARRASEGAHPARLAREVLTEYLATGQLLIAPERLGGDYDSSGGVWISVRDRRNIHLRHARDGFWHFPGEQRGTTAEDIVLAALRTAVQMPQGEAGLKALSESAVAVTFFPALERCEVGALDNDRYGIVVRSAERASWMGGALPRMPGIGGEWAQFQHACRKNGKLVSFEPYELFRHDVVKAVEPGEDWQPTGVPTGEDILWHKDERLCGRVAAHARRLVLSYLSGGADAEPAPLPANLINAKLDSVYLTVYVDGRLRGCMGAVVSNLEEDLRRLARAALDDNRFEATRVTDPSRVAVTVSFLFNQLVLGHFTPEEVVQRVRHGEQTLMAYADQRIGLLLPFVASMHNLDRLRFAYAVLEKARIEAPPYNWCRFDCATWLADARGARPLVGGFPSDGRTDEPTQDLVSRLAALHTDYLIRQQKPDGSFYLRYEPFQNRLYEGLDLPRLAHAAWVLTRAAARFKSDALADAAEKAVAHLVQKVSDDGERAWLETEKEASSVAEVSFLLLALLELGKDDARRQLIPRLTRTLGESIDRHGRISTHRAPAASPEAFQDYFPGQVLLALGAAAEAGETACDPANWRKAFRFYRHRFRYRRHFGQVSWLMQACASWWRATRDEEPAALVFEIGNWLLDYQQEKTGGFINDHQPDAPGYTTALYLEGVCAARALAAAIGDEPRHAKYTASAAHGFRFLEQLVIQQRDATVLPNPATAIGGLRQSVHRSEVRIDFVQHALSALLEFLDK
ncbi:MAG TPA: AMMECR1 domain-containing protein [Pyrinomonadaceae bacterium]|nr:AMMECR1 domain-containing protein [Pyrinomonadaceae bacterium]